MASFAELLETQQYGPNPQYLIALEASINEQVAENTYSLEVCLSVLKIYQFFPEKLDLGIMAKILIKSMMNLPESDFLLCSYLIPATLQEHQTYKILSSLAEYLETGRFKKFWAEVEETRELGDLIPGFKDSCRKFILGVIWSTYARVEKSRVSEFLNLQGEDLEKYIIGNNASTEGADVLFPEKSSSATAKASRHHDTREKVVAWTQVQGR
eukprot:TRINITY_DN42739_c0_g1_i1.p1 TRINITY_DN42739_c0_g1~~TRINITY_DN42739_c0_g1_i1.p1  ORF type:complete len:212 (-),score=49.51 TRINITY_DN42739_c0_g1_i1:114-749(-)